jgi:hypothetical protein
MSAQNTKSGSGKGFSHCSSRCVTGSMGGGARGKGASNPSDDAMGGEEVSGGDTGRGGWEECRRAGAAELRRRAGPS